MALTYSQMVIVMMIFIWKDDMKSWLPKWNHSSNDSADKIIQGNTSNIVFLKSTDDSMLDTLQKMSGTTHKVYADSKTVTKDNQKLFMQIESKTSYTYTAKEMPVISYNDMAFISERNSIVFRAGDSPIWNRNETILPMSWRLFQNTIVHAGHDYSLQTIPTLSSAIDFDVRKNQPDFMQMLDKRMDQACIAQKAMDAYKEAYGYTDFEISQLDPDNYADDIMSVINAELDKKMDPNAGAEDEDLSDPDMGSLFGGDWQSKVQTNDDQLKATQAAEQQQAAKDVKRYAGGLLSREEIMQTTDGANHALDADIISCYLDLRNDFARETQYFQVHGNDLYGADGKVYIQAVKQSETLKAINDAAKDPSSRVFTDGRLENNDLNAMGSYKVEDAFYRFLASLDHWDFCDGRFDKAMAAKMNK